jgi:hypothetical protein
MLVLQSAFMEGADNVTVWVVDDIPRHSVLIEFDSTRADIDRQIDEMLNAVEWQSQWSIDFTLRDGHPLRVVSVSVAK